MTLRKINFIILFFISYPAFPQAVQNDLIKNRIVLPLNGPYHFSSTKDCTVEWNCINREEIKGKITIHNDQWFSFSTKEGGSYYLNIKNQSCKWKRGLQVMVIEGEPCVPSTYTYLNILPKLTLNDIYYVLPELKPNTNYLVSIDGLLGDICEFEIAASDREPNYAFAPADTLPLVSFQRVENLLILEWSLSSSYTDSLESFSVYKKFGLEEFKEIEILQLNYRAYGLTAMEFKVVDTLKLFGDYSYVLVGNRNSGKRVQFKEYNFSHLLSNPLRNSKESFFYKSSYRGKENLTFKVFDYYSGRLLKVRNIANKKYDDYEVNLSKFIKEGIKGFKIEVIYGEETKSKKVFTFIPE